MKRVIREVITLIRIERWLVKEDSATERESAEHEPEHVIEESVIASTLSDDALTDADLRVISQRVIEAQQWEVTPNVSKTAGKRKRS